MSESRELRRILTHLRSAHRLAGIGSWEADLTDGVRLRWSSEVRAIAGWTPEPDPTFEEFVGLIHPDDRPHFLEVRANALAGERPYAIDLRLVRPDGEQRRVHFLAEVLRDEHGRPVGLIGAVQDRTAEIEGLRQLRVTEVARRDLLQRLLVTADTERGRLARHLESGPIDQLVAIEQRLEADMPAEPLQVWVDAVASVRRAVESLTQTLTDMRTEAPSQGLVQILEDLAAESVPGVDVTIDVIEQVSLLPSVQATLLRVVQEALHNIRKHAGPCEVEVRWRFEEGWVDVRVTDDGSGFDVDSMQRTPGHLGIVAMQERIAALGGNLQISSQPGRTTVAARVPVG